MNRNEKLVAVMRGAGVTEDVARLYLEAEEWSVADAILDILAERDAGLL